MRASFQRSNEPMYTTEQVISNIQEEIDWSMSEEGEKIAQENGMLSEEASGFIEGMKHIQDLFKKNKIIS